MSDRKLRVYSLSNYTVNISYGEKKITIKTTDDNVGTISWARKVNHVTITGDAAGGAVANESKDKTGTITITINQLSPYASQLVKLFSASEGDALLDYLCDITIEGRNSKLSVTGYEALPQKLPDESLDQEAGEIEFVFEVTSLYINK